MWSGCAQNRGPVASDPTVSRLIDTLATDAAGALGAIDFTDSPAARYLVDLLDSPDSAIVEAATERLTQIVERLRQIGARGS